MSSLTNVVLKIMRHLWCTESCWEPGEKRLSLNDGEFAINGHNKWMASAWYVPYVSLKWEEGASGWPRAPQNDDDDNILILYNIKNFIMSKRRRSQCVFLGARVFMPRAARFTGNASRTIFPPITRVAQGVMGVRCAVGHTPHTRGCGSPEGRDGG